MELKDYLKKRNLSLNIWNDIDKAEENKYFNFLKNGFKDNENYIFISPESTGKTYLIYRIFKDVFERNRKLIEKKTFALLSDFAYLRECYNSNYDEYTKFVDIDYLAIRLKSLTAGEKRALANLLELRIVNLRITYITTDYVYKDDFEENTGLQGIINKYFTQIVSKNAKVYDSSKKILL